MRRLQRAEAVRHDRGRGTGAGDKWMEKQLFRGTGRESLFIARVRWQGLELITYNWKEEVLKDLMAAIGRVVMHVSSRQLMLQSVSLCLTHDPVQQTCEKFQAISCEIQTVLGDCGWVCGILGGSGCVWLELALGCGV